MSQLPVLSKSSQQSNGIDGYLKMACEEATNAVISNKGGPFGAVVVKDGEIIARAHNLVIETNDPTAHAEITAIRMACAKLGTFSLEGCELYSSCQPCPMCFGACLWARLTKVYYACTEHDAAEAGFDDSYFYSIITDEKKRHEFAVVSPIEGAISPMELWNKKHDRIRY